MEKQAVIVKNTLAQIDTSCEEISDQQTATEGDVHATFRRLQEVLSARETELIGQLDQETQGKLKGLAVQRDQAETTLAKVNSHMYFMKESLSTKYKGNMLIMRSSTIKQANALAAPIPQRPNTEADTRVVFGDNLTAMCQSYGQFQAVHTDVGKPPEEPDVPIEEHELASGAGRLWSSLYGTSPFNQLRFKPQAKDEAKHNEGSEEGKAGTPILTIGGLDGPWGVAVNHRGEVVVTEVGKHCVSVFSPGGKKLRSFGTHGSFLGQFQHPHGVAVDAEGNIVVADSGNHRLQKFTAEGQLIGAVGTKGQRNLEFAYPSDVAFDAKCETLYVADSDSQRIQILTPHLSFRSLLGKKGRKRSFFRPCGIACANTGDVYVTDRDFPWISVFSSTYQVMKGFLGSLLEEKQGKRGVWTCPITLPLTTIMKLCTSLNGVTIVCLCLRLMAHLCPPLAEEEVDLASSSFLVE